MMPPWQPHFQLTEGKTACKAVCDADPVQPIERGGLVASHAQF